MFEKTAKITKRVSFQIYMDMSLDMSFTLV